MTRSAPATRRTSAGVGSNTWASAFGPPLALTVTAGPPTSLAMSASTEKVATTLSTGGGAVSAACASAQGISVAPTAVPVQPRSRRR